MTAETKCPHGRTGEDAMWCLECEDDSVVERRAAAESFLDSQARPEPSQPPQDPDDFEEIPCSFAGCWREAKDCGRCREHCDAGEAPCWGVEHHPSDVQRSAPSQPAGLASGRAEPHADEALAKPAVSVSETRAAEASKGEIERRVDEYGVEVRRWWMDGGHGDIEGARAKVRASVERLTRERDEAREQVEIRGVFLTALRERMREIAQWQRPKPHWPADCACELCSPNSAWNVLDPLKRAEEAESALASARRRIEELEQQLQASGRPDEPQSIIAAAPNGLTGSRRSAPTLRKIVTASKYVEADQAERELRALLAVEKSARSLLQHAEEWFSSEYADHPATRRLRYAYDHLARVGLTGSKR